MPLAPNGRGQTLGQLVRFALVGGPTTALDIALHALLMFVVRVNGELVSVHVGHWLRGSALSGENARAAASPIFKVLTSGIAIVLSFFLNRRFTFEIKSQEGRRRQFVKFILIALVGLALNAGTFKVLAGHLSPNPKSDWAIATVLAACINALWNFVGQKLWAFRQPATIEG